MYLSFKLISGRHTMGSRLAFEVFPSRKPHKLWHGEKTRTRVRRSTCTNHNIVRKLRLHRLLSSLVGLQIGIAGDLLPTLGARPILQTYDIHCSWIATRLSYSLCCSFGDIMFYGRQESTVVIMVDYSDHYLRDPEASVFLSVAEGITA